VKRFVIALLVLGTLLSIKAPAEAQAPPPRPEQPHPDIFSCGVPNCQDYNPTNIEAKATHAIQYRLTVMPGCVGGLIESDLEALRFELDDAVQFRFERNDGAPDFTIRVNCGMGQITICSSVNIWCLGRGFPGVVDIDASDIMYSPVLYPLMTRLSILLHELLHALATWNEQYCLGTETTGLCAFLARFASAPGWVDFMNTGPNSRHLFGEIEEDRWERTMYLLEGPPPGCDGSYGPYDPAWGGCWHDDVKRWFGPDKWAWEPSTGIRYRPDGVAEWGACDYSWRGCFNIRTGDWVAEGSSLFDPSPGIWSAPPL